jgi:hypothetical protein
MIPQKELIQIGQSNKGLTHFSPIMAVIKTPGPSSKWSSWNSMCIHQMPRQTGMSESRNSAINFYPVNPTMIFTSKLEIESAKP